eukprot:11181863-Lingulodinium_polyedra.AAC.1
MLTARCARKGAQFQTTRGGVANIASAGEGPQQHVAAAREVKFRGGWISERGVFSHALGLRAWS